MRNVFLLMPLGAACWAGTAFGTWKLNVARSTFGGETRPKNMTVRIEPHVRGEIFTLDRIEPDGRVTSSSTILYFDGMDRDFRDDGCSGTQSSRRLDAETVEILRKCASGGSARLVRHSSARAKELVIEIIEQYPDGRRFERRMVLEKQ